MKNKKVLLLLLSLLTLLAIYLIWDSQFKSTLRPELRDFAIKDTANVGRIVISDKTPSSIDLDRLNQEKWMADKKFAVRKGSIGTLLKTLYRMEVKTPVAESMKPMVVNNLASTAKRVDIYDKQNKLIKTLFIGGPTQDHLGTFAMIEGAGSPFVVYLPGFDGYLSTRFFTNADEWRDKTVISVDNNRLAFVKISYPSNSNEDFELLIDGLNKFQLLDGKGDEIVPDTFAVQRFMGNFRSLSYEGIVAKGDKIDQDSLKNSLPFFVMEVKSIDGKYTKLTGFKRENFKAALDRTGNYAAYDIDRFYGELPDGKLAIMQYYQFDKALKTATDLRAKN